MLIVETYGIEIELYKLGASLALLLAVVNPCDIVHSMQRLGMQKSSTFVSNSCLIKTLINGRCVFTMT